MYMDIARTVSKRSTCFRLNVGAVLVGDNHLISVGYNGSAPDEPHCAGNDCPLSKSGGCTRARHAEWNAIERMHDSDRKKDLIIYCTHSPCGHCAEHIVNAGIKTVIYETPYRDTSSIDFLLARYVKVFKYTPSGYLINHQDNTVEGL